MLRGMGGMGDLMKKAKKMQEQMQRVQEEVAERTVEATAGGGMVTVVAKGKGEIVSIKIEPDVVDPQDVGMLQDLVLAACNEALRKAKEMVAEEMAKITGGLKIPGLM